MLNEHSPANKSPDRKERAARGRLEQAREKLERELAELRQEAELLKILPRLRITESNYRLPSSGEWSKSLAVDSPEMSR